MQSSDSPKYRTAVEDRPAARAAIGEIPQNHAAPVAKSRDFTYIPPGKSHSRGDRVDDRQFRRFRGALLKSAATPISAPPAVTRLRWLILAILMISVGVGCSTSVRVTDPPRTATEQFLLSTAAKRAVDQLSIESMRGRAVFIDTAYFAASEQPFVLGELRAKLLMGGVQLVPERDKSQIVMEVRSGGVGIDREDFLLGIPSLLLQTGTSESDSGTRLPIATPELAIAKNINQRGIASIAFVAYWRDSGEVVAASGPFIGWTLRDDWWFVGLGRRTIGDIPPAQASE